jgi:leader peptidase (prepilin peptidase) / N-methyltransferase
MDLAAMPAWFWLFTTGCFGALMGSFINAASYRLPRDISMISKARSFCPSCKAQIAGYDNIPILSYLILLGRCRSCKARIPIRYLLVEILVAGLFVAAAYQFFVLNNALLLPYGHLWWRLVAVFGVHMLLIVLLVLLSVVDLEMWLIPVETTLLWIPFGLGLALVVPELHGSATWLTGNHRGDALLDSIMGMILGGGLIWLIGFGTTFFSFYYYKLKGIDERPLEGMGMGDVHLLAMVGAMLGWKAALLTIFIGIFVGSFMGISKVLWEKYKRKKLGDKYKPWQPVYELPPDDSGAGPQGPVFWPQFVFGVVTLLLVGFLFDSTSSTFTGQLVKTYEERAQTGTNVFAEKIGTDFRRAPLLALGGIGVSLIVAFVFLKYLASIDRLPQGSIEDKKGGKEGEKQEVLQGNFIPFGPSLAVAAIIVAFYDPLLRNVAFWFSYYGTMGDIPPLPYKVIGQEALLPIAFAIGRAINSLTNNLVGNPPPK